MCKKASEAPLTQEQSDFAAEHHDRVIGGFLTLCKLSWREYYDVVVFGYLSAARDYVDKRSLHEYSFTTIAYRQMMYKVLDQWRREYRTRRNDELLAQMTSMRMMVKSAEATLLEEEDAQTLKSALLPEQRKVVHLRAEGRSLDEIGRTCGLKRKQVQAALAGARDNIIQFAPKYLEAA